MAMETIREIRKVSHLKNLPIVAVTAKAMKGDREKCIEAGAWDYLSKPVDTAQMLTVLRAWLHRLRGLGVQFHVRHRWLGWVNGNLRFATPEGEIGRGSNQFFPAQRTALIACMTPQQTGDFSDVGAG